MGNYLTRSSNELLLLKNQKKLTKNVSYFKLINIHRVSEKHVLRSEDLNLKNDRFEIKASGFIFIYKNKTFFVKCLNQ